ncbi:MAG: glycosyltransferase family 4 protein [Proteobacteria bacterium]|nr:glycosyltransferase family 4 protein [Pseudomonadota bacterium]
MKIAYVFDQVLPFSAADGEQVMNSMSAMSKLDDVEVTLFLPASNTTTNASADDLRDYFHVDGPFKVELYHSCFPGPRILEKLAHPAVCARFARVLKQFDLIYCRNIPVVCMALGIRMPVVMDTYRPWPLQYPPMGHLFRAFFKNPNFLGMTYHSDYARHAYLDLGIDPEKTCIAHNGFQKAHYEPVLTREQAREIVGLPKDAKIAMYSGRIDLKKGLDHILRLAEARPDVHFAFVGSRERGDFEIVAEQMANCHIFGWKQYGSIAPYLYAADVLIIPPTAGPLKKAGNTVLPIKLYAYLAAGRAIYAPDAPDTAELLEHGRNAWLVKPDDEKAELNGFNALIDNAELIDRLGAEAAKDAENLTWDTRAKIVHDFMLKRLNARNH